MTIKEAKEKLWSIRRAKLEKDRILSLKQKAYGDAICTTTRTDKERISGGISGDTFIRYLEYSEALDRSVSDLFSTQSDIMRVVAVIPDGRCRELIMAYYFEAMTWEETADSMNYSYSSVVEDIHPKALKLFAEKYPIKTDKRSVI